MNVIRSSWEQKEAGGLLSIGSHPTSLRKIAPAHSGTPFDHLQSLDICPHPS
jgi:hypothetical protein